MKRFNDFLSSVIEVSIKDNYDNIFLEELNINSGYKNTTQSWDKLVSSIPKLFTIEEDVKELIHDVIESAKFVADPLFIYRKDKNIFKISYGYSGSLEDVANTKKHKEKGFFVTSSGIKVRLHKKGYGIVAETGCGSVNAVTVKEQETASCIVWNKFTNILREIKEFNNDIFDKHLTEDNIREMVTEISDKFDKEWIATYSKQVYAIWKDLESRGVNPIDFRMDRVGDADSAVGKAHDAMVKKYAVQMTGPRSKKDAFHPGDVIVYNINETSNCIGILKGCMDMMKSAAGTGPACDEAKNAKDVYIKKLISTNIYHSYSLKKITIGRKDAKIGYFNVTPNTGNTCTVDSYDYDGDTSGNNITILCGCNLCLDGMTDSDGNEITNAHGVIVTMRTFGGSDCDIDVTLNLTNTPTFGKCPRRIWRDILNITNSKAETSIKAFGEFLNSANDTEIKEALKKIIQGAIKQGPNCFPFVLIY